MKRFATIIILLATTLSLCAQQRSEKRGVCWDEGEGKQKLTDAPVSKMAPGISWIYNWGQSLQGDASNIGAGDGKMVLLPMCWNSDFNEEALRNYLTAHQGEVKYLLGFNEPNLINGDNHGGSEMTPQQAADAWPRVKKVAEDFGLKLVAPALNFSGDKVGDRVWAPFEWYDEFFRLVPESGIEYLAFHSYMNWYSAVNWVASEYFYTDKDDNLMSAANRATYPNLVKFMDDYKTANGHYPKMFLTEFCAWEGNKDGYTSTLENQIDQMTQKVQKLEQSDLVAGYAWFMGNTSQAPTVYPYNSIFESNTPESELSTLGKVYVYMSSFDKEKYYAPGETILAKDYIDASTDGQQPKVRPNTEESSDIPLQVELQAGSWATYQVDIPAEDILTLNLHAKSAANNSVRIYYDETKSTKKIFDGTVTSTANAWQDREVTSTKNMPAGKHTMIIYNGSNTSLFLNSMQIKQATGISALDNSTIGQFDNSTISQSGNVVYDLQGRKMSNGEIVKSSNGEIVKLSNGEMKALPKGIYIYKGKKFVIK